MDEIERTVEGGSIRIIGDKRPDKCGDAVEASEAVPISLAARQSFDFFPDRSKGAVGQIAGKHHLVGRRAPGARVSCHRQEL